MWPERGAGLGGAGAVCGRALLPSTIRRLDLTLNALGSHRRALRRGQCGLGCISGSGSRVEAGWGGAPCGVAPVAHVWEGVTLLLPLRTELGTSTHPHKEGSPSLPTGLQAPWELHSCLGSSSAANSCFCWILQPHPTHSGPGGQGLTARSLHPRGRVIQAFGLSDFCEPAARRGGCC